jgi:hypothetical protein
MEHRPPGLFEDSQNIRQLQMLLLHQRADSYRMYTEHYFNPGIFNNLYSFSKKKKLAINSDSSTTSTDVLGKTSTNS